MNLCVIPARGGSKRFKNKNRKIFFGKPSYDFVIDDKSIFSNKKQKKIENYLNKNIKL